MEFSDEAISYFIRNCRLLLSFYIIGPINISESIIKTRIDCANKKPKVCHEFHFESYNKNVIEIINNLPHNLTIELKTRFPKY